MRYSEMKGLMKTVSFRVRKSLDNSSNVPTGTGIGLFIRVRDFAHR